MAFLLNDRVKETTTSTGTSTINLAGAETGFESFVSGIGNSNTTYYAIVHQTADEFEVGIGTVTDASPDTLSRTTIISSSNSDSAVNFSAGTKDVFCTLPASKTVFFDETSGGSDVAIGSKGTNPMGIGITGTVLAVSEASNVASVQIDGVTGTRIDMGTSGNRNSVLFTDANGLEISRTTDHPITFKTGASPAERMRIDASGNMGIGTASPGYTLDVSGGTGTISRFTSGGANTYIAITNTSNTGYIGINGTSMEFYPTGTLRGNLDTSGNFVVSGNITAYGSPSDIKLKENIEVIDNALDKVKQLKGITYDLKSDGNRLTGLIAQDLEKVLPEAVYTTKTIANEKEGEVAEEHLAIRYGNTVGLLVEAIKELEARVKELENK